jgi:hypothetical protein
MLSVPESTPKSKLSPVSLAFAKITISFCNESNETVYVPMALPKNKQGAVIEIGGEQLDQGLE